MRRGERRLGLGLRGFRGLHLLGEFLGARQFRRALLGRRRAHALAGGFLFRAQRVGGRNRGPAGGVGRQQRIHQRRVFAAAELGPAYGVGVFPEQLEVDHGRNTTFGTPDGSRQTGGCGDPMTQHWQHSSRGPGGPVRMETDVGRAREGSFRQPAPRRPAGRGGTAAGRLPLAAQSAGDGDQARAAAHRPRRPADRRAGHRDSCRRHRTRGGWPAISTAIRCPAPAQEATPPSTAPTAVTA